MLLQLLYMVLILSVGSIVINILILRFTFLRFLSIINAETLRKRDRSERLERILQNEATIKRSKSVFIFIYLLITAYLWLLWAHFAGTTVSIYKPNGKIDALFIVIGYLLIAFSMRYTQRLMEGRLTQIANEPIKLPEFNFIGLLIFSMYIVTIFYPDRISSIFSWLTYWIY